jgi:hypothetical protein
VIQRLNRRAARRERPETRQRRGRRWLPLAALGALVTLVHLWLADGVLADRLGGAADGTVTRRIEVAFVRELQPRAPVAVVAPAPAPAPRPRVRPPARKASEPDADPPQTVPVPVPVSAPSAAPLPKLDPDPEVLAAAGPASASTPPPQLQASAPDAASSSAQEAVAAAEAASAPAVPSGVADAAAAPASSAPSAVAFEWPPSTRLSYTLSGNYRGPVEGQARVEWLRSGGRYQVHLDVSIGPSFAPLVARRMSSEGEVTEAGLRPRHYQEETRIALNTPRRVDIVLDDGRIRLPSGRELPRPAGVQDAASQFVQMTWMFTLQPALLEPGRSLELPLALPRRVEPWTYDVMARETLYTTMGEVQAVHVRPRRQARPGSDLTAEFWVAPTLQYLPVRIVIRQDADTYIDLLIDRLPQQAAAPAEAAATAPPVPGLTRR